MANKIKFWLNGCDISFLAEAPEDITLKQLLKQCDKIKPHWCACGIKSVSNDGLSWATDLDLIIDYDNIKKTNDNVSCDIKEMK